MISDRPQIRYYRYREHFMALQPVGVLSCASLPEELEEKVVKNNLDSKRVV